MQLNLVLQLLGRAKVDKGPRNWVMGLNWFHLLANVCHVFDKGPSVTLSAAPHPPGACKRRDSTTPVLNYLSVLRTYFSLAELLLLLTGSILPGQLAHASSVTHGLPAGLCLLSKQHLTYIYGAALAWSASPFALLSLAATLQGLKLRSSTSLATLKPFDWQCPVWPVQLASVPSSASN